MECRVCKETFTPDSDISDSELCEACTSKVLPVVNDEICVKNDVTYHVFHNMMRATAKSISSSVVSRYSEHDIAFAKTDLLKSVGEMLQAVDPDLFTDVKRPRRNTESRSKACVLAEDILKILTVVDTTVHVLPANRDQVLCVNPEALSSESIVARVILLEKLLAELTTEMVSLRKENSDLKVYVSTQCSGILPKPTLREADSPLPPPTTSPLAHGGGEGAGQLRDLENDTAAAALGNPNSSTAASGLTSLTSPAASANSEIVAANDAITVTNGATTPGVVAIVHTGVANTSVALDKAPTTVANVPTGVANNTIAITPVVVANGTAAVVNILDGVANTPGAVPTVTNVTAGVANIPQPSNRAAVGQLKHQMHIATQRAAAESAFQAGRLGLPLNEAIDMGITSGAAVAKSYAQTIKNVRGSNTPSQQAGGRTQTHSPPTAAAATEAAATAAAAAASAAATAAGSSGTQLQAAGGSTNKRYPNSAPYVRGTATTNTGGIILGRVKPDYLQNKVLVVKNLELSVTKDKLQNYVNGQAGRHVDLICMTRLDKTYASYASVAIEMNEQDYVLLLNSDFWPRNIWVKPWHGRRFWRGDAQPTRPKPHELKSAVRRSWEST